MTSPHNGQEKVDKHDDITIFYDNGIDYEITINPDKQFDNTLGRVTSITHAFTVIIDKLRDYSDDFEFYPELSEPRYGNKNRGSSPRWHYHGRLKLKDAGGFLLYFLHLLRQYADYSINMFRPEHWPKYMTKQEHIMRPLCKHYRVPYKITPSNNIFKTLVKQKKKDKNNSVDIFSSFKET